MNATEAKELTTNSKSSATTALLAAIDSAIQAAASKGNNRLCTKALVADYGSDVVLEVYNQLRALGYKANPLNCVVYW
jgi:hypothetical protein